MRRYLMLLASFCAMALAAILYIRPTPAVRLEGELALLTPEHALERLERDSGKFAFSDNLALTHSHLALASGDFAAARKALDGLSGRNDVAVLVEDQLTEIARMSGNLPEATRHLAAANRIDPTPERRVVLGEWYRIQRNAGAEAALLQSVPLRDLSQWEVERLAQLLSRSRRFGELETLLRTASEWGDRKTDVFRARFVDYLAEEGRLKEAGQATLTWFERSKPSQRPLLIALPVLIDRGAVDSAYAIARQSLELAPDTVHEVIPLFVRSGHRGLALDLQSRWLAASRPTTSRQWDTLVEIASATGDLRGLRTGLSTATPDEVDVDTLGKILIQFLRYQGVSALVPYRDFLGPEALAASPLVGAAWTGAQRQQEQALAYLAAAAAQPMIDWDRQIWVAIATGLRGTPGYRLVMESAASDDGLRALINEGFISATQPGPTE